MIVIPLFGSNDLNGFDLNVIVDPDDDTITRITMNRAKIDLNNMICFIDATGQVSPARAW